jgi:hypothetical protein
MSNGCQILGYGEYSVLRVTGVSKDVGPKA